MTMRKAVLAVCLTAACGGGCRRGTEGDAERVATLEQRVAALEQANAELRDRLTSPAAATRVDVDTQAVVRAVASCVNQVVSNAVEAQLDQRLGNRADINAIFDEAVRQGLDTREAQKTAEREEQRKQWQKRMEEQRAKWEEGRTQRLAQELGLSDAQTADMKKVEAEMREAMRKKMEALGQQGGGFNLDALRTASEELRAQNDEAVARILTPEQFEKYKSRPRNLLSLMSGLLGGGQPGAGGAGAPQP